MKKSTEEETFLSKNIISNIPYVMTPAEHILYNIVMAQFEKLLKDTEPKCTLFMSDGTTEGLCIICGKHQSEHINYK